MCAPAQPLQPISAALTRAYPPTQPAPARTYPPTHSPPARAYPPTQTPGDAGSVSLPYTLGIVIISSVILLIVTTAMSLLMAYQHVIYAADTLAKAAMTYSSLTFGPGEIHESALDKLAKEMDVTIEHINQDHWPMGVKVEVSYTMPLLEWIHVPPLHASMEAMGIPPD